MVNFAKVKIWGEFVGIILWDNKKQSTTFEFDRGFVSKGWDLAPIKMPITSRQRIFSFPELTKTSTFSGLPGLLADALPDKYGNALIDRWLAQQDRPAGRARPKAIIAYNKKTGEIKSGQTRALKGFEHYLIKLDGLSYPQAEQLSLLTILIKP